MKRVAAVVQLCSTMDVEANLDAVERFTCEAAAAGAEIVATPENSAFLRTDPRVPAPVQDLDGAIISRAREIAEKAGVWMLFGSFPERAEVSGKYHNTSVVIDGTRVGAPVIASYRKLHLFDIEIKGGESQRESDYIVAGQGPVVVDIAGVSTGLSICYDLRFPDLYQQLVDDGARILTVPAAFTEYTGKEHWLLLLRARAVETQTYVLAPNQFGHHGGKRRSYGKSTIVDPWGATLCVAPDRPGWAMAPLDFDYLETVRSSLPCLMHRHPALRGAIE